MIDSDDPYEILGLPRGSGLADIRAAYCRLAVKCHPDNCPGDRREATRQFRRLTKAYQAIARTYGKRFSAADFTRMDPRFGGSRESSAGYRWGGGDVTDRRREPRLNETRAFVYLWVIAIVLGLGGATALVAAGIIADDGIIGLLQIHGVAILIYFCVIALAVIVLPMTRRIIVMTVQLGFRLLPALTAKRADSQQTSLPDRLDSSQR